ncbi:MAG: FtsQ-type POTRA domain-containing protein [Acidimicrobiales bacterium]
MTPPSLTEHRRPVPAIDPRIRARRIAVQRDEGRRRLQRLGMVGGAAAVALGAAGIAISPLLDVDHVVVTGASHVDPKAVEVATGIERGDPLVALDAAGAAEAVRALPWVAEVSVEHSWPGTVEVAVVEREPVAAVLHPDGQASLVDAEGRVLEEVAADATGVILVTGLPAPGPPGSTMPDSARGAVAVADGIPAALHPVVERLVVDEDDRLRLEVRLEEGAPPALVLLGRDDQLTAKLAALATVVASVDLAGLAVIDLEVPSAPALTRR